MMEKTVYDALYEVGKEHAKHVIWVFSDLQQPRYESAKACLSISMEDYDRLGKPAQMIWYLGDSTEGRNLEQLYKMTELQEEAYGSLGIPLCYATGNHDYDYAEQCMREGRTDYEMPFYDMVRRHPGWHTTLDTEDTWFKVNVGNYAAYFFCDHVAHDNSWCATHNRIRWGGKLYPYTESYFAGVRAEMAKEEQPRIITAAHCAFPGGNRETEILSHLQPLPLKTRLHLYGHAHIGEYLCPKERVFSQIQWIDWQDIPQVDVASFENVRGSYCHSVILQIYEDDTLGLFFRNHDAGCFESAFFPSINSYEKEGNFEKRKILSWASWDGTLRPEN